MNIHRLLLAFVILGAFSYRSLALPAYPERPVAGSAPTGDDVVYVLNGDIYSRNLPNGAPCRLTHDGANSDPHWSPSGRWIVFRHNVRSFPGQIRLVRRDGTGEHALPCADDWQSSYSFSPDGDEVAVVTEDGALAAMPLAGGRLRTLVSRTRQCTVTSVAWSPDGRSLAYTDEHEGTRERGDHPDYCVRLWRIDASMGHARLLFVSKGHEAVPLIARWSADSRDLLFWALRYSPAGSVNADGVPLYLCSAVHRTSDAHPLFGRSDVLTDPDFIAIPPRGGRAAISVGDDRYVVRNKRIALVNLATGAARPVTPSRLAAIYPTWSPDGTRIAYLAAPNVAGDRPMGAARVAARVWTMNADGSKQTRLESGQVDDYAVGPKWLSDSKHLLIERVEARGGEETRSLWLIGDDGRGLRGVVPRVGAVGADWRGDVFDVWSPARASFNGAPH